MKSQAYRMALLFDFYGDVLTDRQKEFYDLYYNEDLSLGEIAQEVGISRQGVHDTLTRAEASLRHMEAKTGCVARDRAMDEALSVIRSAAQQLSRDPSPGVQALAQKILAAASPF